jgi:hypothetical protein
MKPGLLIFSFVLLSLSACKKQKIAQNLEGSYTGIFYRSAPAIDYRPSTVTLKLEGNNFSGTSDIIHYPAICNGAWSINTAFVKFENKCAWTADFDWRLILDGDFSYELDGRHLKLWKSYGNGMYDTYELDRQ